MFIPEDVAVIGRDKLHRTIGRLDQEVFLKVKEMIQSKHVALTCDLWCVKSQPEKSLICITAHFIIDWQLKHCVIGVSVCFFGSTKLTI